MGAASSTSETRPPLDKEEPAVDTAKEQQKERGPQQVRKTLYDIVLAGLDELAATAPKAHKEEMLRMGTRLLDFYIWSE